MPTQPLNEDQYIVELNRQLKLRSEYRDGMAFEAYPSGATGTRMSGYSITGPWSQTLVYATVAHKVAEEYHLKTG